MLPQKKKIAICIVSESYGTGVKTGVICNVVRCGMDEVIHHSVVVGQVLLQHYDTFQLAD